MEWYYDCDVELSKSIEVLKEACADVLAKASACESAEHTDFDIDRVTKAVSRALEDL